MPPTLSTYSVSCLAPLHAETDNVFSGLRLSVQVMHHPTRSFPPLNQSSAKMSLAIDGVLKPLFDAGGIYDGKVKAVIRLQVQPWHSSSTLTHESALAVSTLVYLASAANDLTGGTCLSQSFLAL